MRGGTKFFPPRPFLPAYIGPIAASTLPSKQSITMPTLGKFLDTATPAAADEAPDGVGFNEVGWTVTAPISPQLECPTKSKILPSSASQDKLT